MVRYFGPDNGSAYVQLPNGRFAAGKVAQVYADADGQVPADILGGTREVQGSPIDEVIVDATGRLNFWFPDDQPVCWVSVNGGPLVRVTADLQDQLDDAVIGGGGGGGGDVTQAELDAAIATHSADTTAVHGIANTAVLETQSGAQSKANAAQAAAATDATNKVAAHVAASDPHGDRAYTDGLLSAKADLVGGKVPSSQIPAVAITQFLGSVGSQAAMLALTGELGDWAVRTDTGTTWIITGSDPTQLASWTQVATPTDAVTSVNGLTGVVVLAKGNIGLGNVDNTSDASKPVSTAQQAALDGKQPLDSDLTAIAALDSAQAGVVASDGAGWLRKTYSAVKTALGLTKSDVGLSNVDNTSDASKPVSTAQQAALDLKAPLASPTFTGTVSGVTKAMVGLGNVDNTSDAAKPLSTAATTALAAKADLVGGVVPTAQLPALAISEVFTAASQVAMLALTAQRGDVALRTDVGKTFILSTDSPSTLADWKEIAAIGVVQSVNGQTGVVVLSKTDVGLSAVVNALQLQAANNLSDLANAATARTNLGVPPSTRTLTAGTGLTGGGDLSADRSFAVSYGTTAGTAAQGNDSRITGAEQTTNKGAASGYAGLNAQGIVPAAQRGAAVVALTDGTTIATNAALGNSFSVTLGGNRTLSNPTNPTDGQLVMWAIRQDGTGSRTLALDTQFRLTAAVTSTTLSTGAGKTDYLGARYNATDTKWDVIAFAKAA